MIRAPFLPCFSVFLQPGFLQNVRMDRFSVLTDWPNGLFKKIYACKNNSMDYRYLQDFCFNVRHVNICRDYHLLSAAVLFFRAVFSGTFREIQSRESVSKSPAWIVWMLRAIFSSGQSHHLKSSSLAMTFSGKRFLRGLAGTPPTMV